MKEIEKETSLWAALQMEQEELRDEAKAVADRFKASQHEQEVFLQQVTRGSFCLASEVEEARSVNQERITWCFPCTVYILYVNINETAV